MSISTVFDTPPTPPSSTDKTNFRVRYDAFFAYIVAFVAKLITFVTQINALEANVNAKEASAVAAQTAAAASANFQGTYTNQTAAVGQSWLYNGIVYRVLIAGNQTPAAAPANWTPVAPSYGSISGTFNTTANGWYRIAQSPLGQTPVDARFNISWTLSTGNHGSVRIAASSTYGQSPCLSQISYSKYGTGGITQSRIVYHTTASGNYAYLEVMFAGALTNITVTVEAFDIAGWSLLPPSTAGSIPAGYTALTYAFKSTITPGTYPVVTVDSDGSVTGGSTVLPNTTTATTPAAGDNSTKVATTAFIGEKKILGISNYAQIEYQLGSGTNPAATVATTWITEPLNTVISNNISGASLASNIVSLPAGTYHVKADCVVGVSSAGMKFRIKSSIGTVALSTSNGTRGYAINNGNASMEGDFTLASSGTVFLEYWASSAHANGLGYASSSGDAEVYARLQIWKVA